MAFQNETSAAVPKAATVLSAIEDFDPIIGRLETLLTRAASSADRIVGARPSPVEGAEKNPTPNHLIYAIQARRERLMRVADHMEAEMSRIENGLA